MDQFIFSRFSQKDFEGKKEGKNPAAGPDSHPSPAASFSRTLFRNLSV